MKNSVLFILLMSLVLTFNACKKDPPAPVVEEPPVHVPDFEITGKRYVFSPVKFKSNFTENKQLTWNFGNDKAETIMGTEISHTYETAGTYNVSMSIVDSFGGVVSKNIIITYGSERVSGKQEWHFFLKAGDPIALLPTKSFSREFALNIINDTTIQIPDIPEMRQRGPYTVKKRQVTDSNMVYKSDDNRMEMSYKFANFTGGIKIVQLHKDTSWTLTGLATIVN